MNFEMIKLCGQSWKTSILGTSVLHLQLFLAEFIFFTLSSKGSFNQPYSCLKGLAVDGRDMLNSLKYKVSQSKLEIAFRMKATRHSHDSKAGSKVEIFLSSSLAYTPTQ